MPKLSMVAPVVMVMCCGFCPIRGAEEKLLCPEGVWEGTCRGWPRAENRTLQVRLDPGFIGLMEGDQGIVFLRKWIDEGCGKCTWKNRGGEPALGIYKWEGGNLILCFREPGKGRPKEFSSEKGELLIRLVPKSSEKNKVRTDKPGHQDGPQCRKR